jgi:hypothetical protein
MLDATRAVTTRPAILGFAAVPIVSPPQSAAARRYTSSEAKLSTSGARAPQAAGPVQLGIAIELYTVNGLYRCRYPQHQRACSLAIHIAIAVAFDFAATSAHRKDNPERSL